MTRILPHEWGVSIRCDVRGCTSVHQTGNILIGVNRDHAREHGWWFTRSRDYCPTHSTCAKQQAREARLKRRRELAAIRRAARKIAAEREQQGATP